MKTVNFKVKNIEVTLAWNRLLIENVDSGVCIFQVKLGLKNGIFQIMSRPWSSDLSMLRIEHSIKKSALRGITRGLCLEVDIFYRAILVKWYPLKRLYRVWDSHDILICHKTKKLVGIRRHNWKSTIRNYR